MNTLFTRYKFNFRLNHKVMSIELLELIMKNFYLLLGESNDYLVTVKIELRNKTQYETLLAITKINSLNIIRFDQVIRDIFTNRNIRNYKSLQILYIQIPINKKIVQVNKLNPDIFDIKLPNHMNLDDWTIELNQQGRFSYLASEQRYLTWYVNDITVYEAL